MCFALPVAHQTGGLAETEHRTTASKSNNVQIECTTSTSRNVFYNVSTIITMYFIQTLVRTKSILRLLFATF